MSGLGSEPSPHAEEDAANAIRSRYVRTLFTVPNMLILLGALVWNLWYHHHGFNLLSDKLALYRNMHLVMAGLALDFFLLCLIALVFVFFQSWFQGRIYYDLYLTGLRPWTVHTPLLQCITLAILLDTLLETSISAAIEPHNFVVGALGVGVGLIYGLISGWFIAVALLCFNLHKLNLTLQILSGYAFTAFLLYVVSSGLDSYTAYVGRKTAFARVLGLSVDHQGYFLMLIAVTIALVPATWLLTKYARRLSTATWGRI